MERWIRLNEGIFKLLGIEQSGKVINIWYCYCPTRPKSLEILKRTAQEAAELVDRIAQQIDSSHDSVVDLRNCQAGA
ncbi:hypothetical protein [Hydrogenispora ethanolica]|nr:hypothetical protein [Hydrogenispora ethanolica]